MAHLAIIPHQQQQQQQFVVFSWTTGITKVSAPRRICTDDDASAYALYLVRHGQIEEAEVFLDNYCR